MNRFEFSWAEEGNVKQPQVLWVCRWELSRGSKQRHARIPAMAAGETTTATIGDMTGTIGDMTEAMTDMTEAMDAAETGVGHSLWLYQGSILCYASAASKASVCCRMSLLIALLPMTDFMLHLKNNWIRLQRYC